MTRKFIIIFVLTVILYSCNNSKSEYYDSGEIHKYYKLKTDKIHGIYKEFYENGNVKEISIYNQGAKKDSSVYFYADTKLNKIDYYLKNDTIFSKVFEDSKLSSMGKYLKGKKVQKWKYFNTEGSIEKTFEYIDLCGTQYTNQGWYFNKDGDTLLKNSNHFKILNLKRHIGQNEVLNIKMIYDPLFENNSQSFICMSPKIQSDYCNISTVKLDTVYSYNNSFEIPVRFSKKGAKNLRGFVTEFRTGQTNKDPAQYNERRVYFDIPIIVK